MPFERRGKQLNNDIRQEDGTHSSSKEKVKTVLMGAMHHYVQCLLKICNLEFIPLG